MSEGGSALYLYCFAPFVEYAQCSVPGVDGRPSASLCVCAQIGAILCEVELAEFCGEAAEARLQDLAWLGPQVCRHEAVIEEAMRWAPVLPARFGTLFTSHQSLQHFAALHREVIEDFFSRLGDCQEWAVKGMLDRPGAMEKFAGSEQSAAGEAPPVTSPGARYFQEKRLKAQLERDFRIRLREFCQRAAAMLGAKASGFKERKVVDSATDGSDAELVLNWAFLLSPAALDAFRSLVDQLNQVEAYPGLTLTLTGPWPPYSFTPELSGDEGS